MAFVILNLEKRLILIAGTEYAGEIKKSIFTTLKLSTTFQRGSADALFERTLVKMEGRHYSSVSRGLEKTTLSSDPDRALIGDDEHGWGDDGIFNFEGGCYAKTIKLSQELEPLIWNATRHFGTILENVTINPNTRRVNFDDDSLTENTRAAYPVGFLDNIVPNGLGTHPENIFFLTADAFGVMPPISRLTPEQAMYYFLSGYTSKLGGTEKGVTEPQATFSACFGAPFLPLHPNVYAKILGEKIAKHNSKVWLVNTGWTGGPYGIGSRISLPFTRAMVSAALNGDLDGIPTRIDPFFGVSIPETVPGVPNEILNPSQTWSDKEAYDRQARVLIEKFQLNFAEYAGEIDAKIGEAGPG